MRTRIISAFAGTGKSYYNNLHPDTTLDSDSSNFSWVTNDGKKVRNPDFHANYIKHIKENVGKYEFIFVSSHDVVREALLDNCLHFYLIYPSTTMKDEFVVRYTDRGSPQSFIDLLDNKWNDWILECQFCMYGCTNVEMVFPTLTSELRHIVCSENGDKIEN